MSMRRLCLLLCAVLISSCRPPASETEEYEERPAVSEPQPLSARHLADLIAADGARHTVQVLTGPADPTAIQQVFDGIATGHPDWLAIVPAIEPELDAAQVPALRTALRAALGPNAAGVLALVPDHADPAEVCKAIDAPRRAAVEAVTDPGLQAARHECILAF